MITPFFNRFLDHHIRRPRPSQAGPVASDGLGPPVNDGSWPLDVPPTVDGSSDGQPASTTEAPGAPPLRGEVAVAFARALPGGTVMPDGDVSWEATNMFKRLFGRRDVGTVGPDGRLHRDDKVGSIASDGWVAWEEDSCCHPVKGSKPPRPKLPKDTGRFANALNGRVMPDGDVVWHTPGGWKKLHVGTVGSDGNLHSGNKVGYLVGPTGDSAWDVSWDDDPCYH